MGKVTVSANVEAFHILTTTTEHYKESVTEYYTRDVFDNYYRDVTDVYQRYAQRYLVPVFEKKLEGAYNGTLVTRLDYSDNTTKAKPTNGGAFKNGHTYVTVDVAEASKEDGVNYTIADSSKNNGKKAPDQYNRPIEYQYNVKIADGKLTVSFPADLAYASVGAEVWDKAPKDAKNAPKHVQGSVTVDVPKNDGTVDLYVHIEKLGWYEVDEEGNFVYQFKAWKYDHTEYGRDWLFIETKYGDYVQGATTYGEPEFVREETTKKELLKTETSTANIEEQYTGKVTLLVDDVETPLNTEIELEPGVHTFVLSVEGLEDISKTVQILPGDNPEIVFTASFHNSDNDDTATVEVTDSTETTQDITYKEPVRVNNDNDPTCLHLDEYLYRPDIKLGDETDPDGEHAVKLN